MLLKNIISGRESSKFIVIYDTASHSGHALTRCLVKAQLSRLDGVVALLFDLSVEKFLQGFGTEEKQRLICHDFYTDLCNWDGQRKSSDDILEDLVDAIKSSSKGQSKVGVVIDSLSPILAEKPLHLVCHNLQKLINSTAVPGVSLELVVLVHADLHSELVLNSLRYLATTCIELELTKQTSNQDSSTKHPCGRCGVTHCKKSGKVLRKKQLYSIGHDLSVIYFPEEDWVPHSFKQQNDQQQEVDPTASLTFNLRLSEKEREARENLRLPYTLDTQAKTSILQSSNKETGSSQIFYHPDDVDDFDDDDPDDDLDV